MVWQPPGESPPSTSSRLSLEADRFSPVHDNSSLRPFVGHHTAHFRNVTSLYLCARGMSFQCLSSPSSPPLLLLALAVLSSSAWAGNGPLGSNCSVSNNRLDHNTHAFIDDCDARGCTYFAPLSLGAEDKS
jgi:hypothetical protein